MKTLIILITMFFFYFSQSQALDTLFEANAAYFYPTDPQFRKIYSGGGIYRLKTCTQVWEQFYPWISIGVFSKSGSSIGEGDKTRITIVPLGFGFKYLPLFDRFFRPYLEVGGLASYVHIHDYSPYVVKKNSRVGAGGIIKIGLLTYLAKFFFLDFFCDYSFMKVNFNTSYKEERHHGADNKEVTHHRADLSGFSFGGGIGFSF